MKLQFGRKASDIIASIYIIGTLFLRIILEPQLNGHYLISLALGAFGLLFLWALIKSKILNPSFFGLWPGEEAGKAKAA
jgi:hypothetical protein